MNAGNGASDRADGTGWLDDPPGTLVHRRTIEFQAFDAGDHLVVDAQLRDDRPWADGERDVAALHDMTLRVAVRKDDLVIDRAEAVMRRYPHVECPSITEAFGGLVGLGVGRGYTRAVQERFGGAAGCAHLEQLARTIGPVVIQGMTSIRAKARDWSRLEEEAAEGPRLFPRNTCHVFADGGVAEQKLAAGWRPGVGGYPAPPVEVFVRRAADDEG
ncbi:MAG TPA: DUF2889 domain-containing protein [Acidimicrobiales bacterium]|nr:DUF2889 domain-containing protein [Acidimicrobiales bacterium]